jgi:hypothetical protein
LGIGYWVLGTGYWVLGIGYWVLGISVYRESADIFFLCRVKYEIRKKIPLFHYLIPDTKYL